jgi:hypothetical protein
MDSAANWPEVEMVKSSGPLLAMEDCVLRAESSAGAANVKYSGVIVGPGGTPFTETTLRGCQIDLGPAMIQTATPTIVHLDNSANTDGAGNWGTLAVDDTTVYNAALTAGPITSISHQVGSPQQAGQPVTLPATPPSGYGVGSLDVTSIVVGVWGNSSGLRTLTGTFTPQPAAAGRGPQEIFAQCFAGGTADLAALVTGRNGDPLVPGTIQSIAYTIWPVDEDGRRRPPLLGQQNVSVAPGAVLFATLQSDDAFSNYNFRHQPDCLQNPAFPDPGAYVVQYTLQPASGEPLSLQFRVNAL